MWLCLEVIRNLGDFTVLGEDEGAYPFRKIVYNYQIKIELE